MTPSNTTRGHGRCLLELFGPWLPQLQQSDDPLQIDTDIIPFVLPVIAMSSSQTSPLDSVDGQISPPSSYPLQLRDGIPRPGDQDVVPLVGKPATNVRAPKPAGLTWTQLQNVENDTSREYAAVRSAASHSGPVSPISPISSSEALRTPNVDRQRIPHMSPSSPGASSQVPPRLHSPASQIFERSVQEDMLPAQASPSIPAHIRTDNYIPPVLEASSAAITDEQLDPDSVEIVTHSLHQPATGIAASSTADQSLSSSGIVDHAAVHSSDADEMSSSYGALDTTDVRRLSFISFADVVNAEHAETGESVYSRDPSQSMTASGNPIAAGYQNRSPSPLRSPASSHGLGTSPPTSIATSFQGPDMSPNHGVRRPGSPLPLAQSPVSSNFGGDLNVETMRQALRKTGSGDLGGMASQTAGAVGNDEVLYRPF